MLEIRQTESRLEWSNAGLMHSHERNTGFKSRMQERKRAPLRRKHDRFLSRFPSPSNNVGLSQGISVCGKRIFECDKGISLFDKGSLSVAFRHLVRDRVMFLCGKRNLISASGSRFRAKGHPFVAFQCLFAPNGHPFGPFECPFAAKGHYTVP